MLNNRLSGLAAIVAMLALSACASLPWPATSSEPAPQAGASGDPIVLLIGLDGLRFDAIDRHSAPNLTALAARGTRPERMYSVMPTKTFVNFYSIATGLYPENHGMLSNSPWDNEAQNLFSARSGDTQDPFWWGGEPIWKTAEDQGLRAHVMFWLGSEVEGQRPTLWHAYEHDRPYDTRVDEVLAWFDAPEAEQPDFAAVYFDHVDSVTHRNGIFGEAEASSVALVDGLVGDLVAGLEERGLIERTTILIVSDHGMSNVSLERLIFVDDYDPLDGIFIAEHAGRFGAGLEPYLYGFGEPEDIDRAFEALQGAHPHLSVYRRGEMPDHFRINHPTRGPDLLITADPGWQITMRDTDLTNPYYLSLQATHGWDNYHDDMGATFIGAGPIFPAGSRPAGFDNVNVYGLIACALGIEPAATDGDPAEIVRITGGLCPAR